MFKFWFICSVLLFSNVFSLDITVELEKLDNNPNKLIFKRDNVIVQEILIDPEEKHLKYELIKDDLLEKSGKSVIHYNEKINLDYRIFQFTRNLNKGDVAKECVNLDNSNLNWYGGPEQKHQYWPVQKLKLSKYSYISKEQDNAAVSERYWLNSNGVFIYVQLETPLFIDQNSQYHDHLCLIAEQHLPYNTRTDDFNMIYYVGIAMNSKIAHNIAIENFLNKPLGYPDERMIRHPIWSTWARYKKNINEHVVLKFADEILSNKFENSQLEIDDDWETCYGTLEFNKSKFPNMKNLTDILKSKGFRVTLWIHPFINKNCEPIYSEAKSKGYFIRDHHNNTDTKWWNTGLLHHAAHIDFTNPEAADWFTERLKKIREDTGIDSFKFDAGESSWIPSDPVLPGLEKFSPHTSTIEYVKTVSKFGSMIEVRAAQGTQELPIFLRMLDKDSNWDYSNGLATLVTTLLQLNMVGYPLVLPDMIGGNGYFLKPNKELFIRWLQANTFMPSLQFSYVPWDYDQETIEISHKFTKLHEKYSDEIINRFKLAVAKGDPVNPPIWWIDPNDKIAQGIYDQFLLGEDIIVAPALEKGMKSRDIYLPIGSWKDGNSNLTYEGPMTLKNYPTPIDVLPYFVRNDQK